MNINASTSRPHRPFPLDRKLHKGSVHFVSPSQYVGSYSDDSRSLEHYRPGSQAELVLSRSKRVESQYVNQESEAAVADEDRLEP